MENSDHIKSLVDFLKTHVLNANSALLSFDVINQNLNYEILGKEIFEIAVNKKFVSLLSESGISDFSGIFSEAFSKIGKKILPEIIEEEELTKAINYYFPNKRDFQWLKLYSDKDLANLLLKINWPKNANGNRYIEREVLNAVVILAQKIASIGIEREVVSKIATFDDLDSPFLGLNRDVILFVEKILSNHKSVPTEREDDYNHILVMLSQCKIEMSKLYKHKDLYGISLRMTVLIRKLEKYLGRLNVLLSWIQSIKKEEKALILAVLLKELVETQNTKNSLRTHFKTNLEFLSFKIVENTSKSGENFIAGSKVEYWQLFRRALGGGVIVAFLCWFKTSIYFQYLPAFWNALFYSLNYAFGFVLIHLLKLTLATKQPAMTASTIASSLSNNGENLDWLNKSSKLLIRQIRSQFISLVGNVIIAFPIAFIIGWVYFYYTGTHIADFSKANKIISEINVFKSLAIFHAAIAGVYLMLSGLISGYYENIWVYNNMNKRITQNNKLISIFGEQKNTKIANYMDQNIGGIAGNVFLGFLLGSTATIGQAFGLPLDIRHVTFASGNFGIGMVSLNNSVNQITILYTILGIIVIGMVNVFVSFGLSILIALNSRGTTYFEIKLLMQKLLGHFFSNGTSFFYPSRTSKRLTKKTEL